MTFSKVITSMPVANNSHIEVDTCVQIPYFSCGLIDILLEYIHPTRYDNQYLYSYHTSLSSLGCQMAVLLARRSSTLAALVLDGGTLP